MIYGLPDRPDYDQPGLSPANVLEMEISIKKRYCQPNLSNFQSDYP